jgi:hypothetical protein
MNIQEIQQTLSSELPPSLERAATVLKKAVAFFPELQKQIFSGSTDEKAEAQRIGRMLCQLTESEIVQTCQALHLPSEVFHAKLFACWSAAEIQNYQDAWVFIRTHHHELFPPPPISKKLPKILSSRKYC